MDWNKVCRIGIDRIALTQFEVLKLENFCIFKSNIIPGLEETYIENNKLFFLKLEKKNTKQGIVINNFIAFNPNVVLEGNNVKNSREEELIQAVKIIEEKLEKDFGVKTFLLNSRIQSIELNNNLLIDISELKSILELAQDGYDEKYKEKIKYKKYKKSHSFSIRDTEKREGIILDVWMAFGTYEITIYGKNYEVDNEEILKEHLTRFEITLEEAYNDNLKNKYCIKNTLKELTENIEVIDKLFIYYLEKYFFGCCIFEIERIKKDAELEYIKYKKFGKCTETQGVVRSVYESIKRKNYVFDYAFIIDLVKKYDSKHKGREIKRVINTLQGYKNLRKINYLVEYFFAPQSPNCGENKKIQIELTKLKAKELERLLLEK